VECVLVELTKQTKPEVIFFLLVDYLQGTKNKKKKEKDENLHIQPSPDCSSNFRSLEKN